MIYKILIFIITYIFYHQSSAKKQIDISQALYQKKDIYLI